MATALAQGFIHAGLIEPRNLLAGDPVEAARQTFARQTGGRAVASNREVVESASVLLLAVKPDQVRTVLEEVGSVLTENHLLLSIVAGLSLAKLEAALPLGTKAIRLMPNTAALVGASATAFALGHAASNEDAELARRLFSTVGRAFQVKESLLDAVTGLSGSGPAYGFLAIEALSDGGVAAGLPRDIATTLAAQTLLGSAKLVLETGAHPASLKDMVASPGGTTIEGLHQLEKAGVRAAFINAVRAAAKKSKDLGAS